jgi:hypothetical protein
MISVAPMILNTNFAPHVGNIGLQMETTKNDSVSDKGAYIYIKYRARKILL